MVSGLAVEALQWVGLRSHQINQLDLHHSCFDPLTDNDFKKIDSLLARGDLSEPYKAEVHEVQAGGRKCELESLYTLGIGYVSEFFKEAIRGKDYI